MQPRGGGGGGRGGGGPGRGGGGGRGGGPSAGGADKPKREAILDLAKYQNERIRVKFTGGREGQLFGSAACSDLNETRSYGHPQGV